MFSSGRIQYCNLTDALGHSLESETVSYDVKMLSAILEGSQVAMFLMEVVNNETFTYKYVNQAYLDLFMFKMNDVIGRSPHEIFDEELSDRLGELLLKCESNQEKVNSELRIYCNNEEHWVSVALSPVIDQNKVIHIVGSNKDISETKRILRIRDENEAYLRRILETTQEGFWVVSENGVIDDVNEAYCKMTGFERDEIIGRNIEFFDVIDSSDQVKDRIAKIIQHGYMQFETQHRKKDGTIFEIELTVSLANHNPIELVSFCRDISEKKHYERELRTSMETIESANWRIRRNEKILLEAQRMAHIGSYILDFKTGMWESSVELNHIFGIPNDYEKTVEGWLALVHPEHVDTMSNHLAETSKNHVPFDKIYKINRFSSGEMRWVHGIGEYAYDEYGNPITMMGCIQDITDQMNYEFESQERQKMIQTIVNLTPDSLYIYDLNTSSFIFSNQGIERVLGYTSNEVRALGSSIVETLMHPDDYTHYKSVTLEELNELMDNEQIIHEFRMHTKSGEWRFLSAIETVYKRNESGRPEQIFGVIHDITDIKMREEELTNAKEVAEEAYIAKTQFLANMSHEIRTPLNGIMGMLQLLETTELDEEQTDYIEMCQKSSDSLLRIINDILEYSKIESNQVEFKSVPFDLMETLVELETLFQPALHDIRLSTFIKSDVPTQLIGDAFRIKQILTNLVGNAIKFTPSGEINIYVRHLASVDMEKVCLEFRVTDTGIGIPKNKIKSIFERFTQVDASNTRQRGGSGLGLAICKGLVQQMGGQIWVESSEGHGSVFTFTIHLKQATRQLRRDYLNQEDELIENEFQNPIHVLIVEDDYTSRKVLEQIVIRKGWKVTLAEDGLTALEHYKCGKFDVIVMDVQMPHMDGYKTTGLIRHIEKSTERHTPIIAMTAYALSGDREKCIEAGMDDYVIKPIHFENFCKSILEWARLSRYNAI